MNVIKLDAATLEQFRSAEGQVILADEAGRPVRLCVMSSIPMSEPELTDEEWQRRTNPAGGMTTAQVLEHLKGLAKP